MDALTRGPSSTTTAAPALIFLSAGPSCSINELPQQRFRRELVVRPAEAGLCSVAPAAQ